MALILIFTYSITYCEGPNSTHHTFDIQFFRHYFAICGNALFICTMGHSVKVYEDSVQITALEFGASNYIKASYIYKILNAEKFNNGVSGNGQSKYYKRNDIINATEALTYFQKEPFDMVRNRIKEQQAESFIYNLTGSMGSQLFSDDLLFNEI